VAKIQRFEDFIAWQKARVLTARVYKLTNQGGFTKDYGLRDQIRRSSVSIMANIAEGFERSAAAQFQHFLAIAKASCAELRSHFYVALNAGYLDATDFRNLIEQAAEVGQIVGGLRASVERRQHAI
jgi:four helix bundle protein